MKQTALAVLVLSVGAYASDCGTMNTAEQAMQCCQSMQCSSHHHHHRGQECCNTMPAMHAALGQPPSAQGGFLSLLAIGAVSDINEFRGMELTTRMIAEHSHAPPMSSSPAGLPLRI